MKYYLKILCFSGLIFLSFLYIKFWVHSRNKSSVAVAQTITENLQKPVYRIFLIHGIAGSKEHFGAMQEALMAVLNKKGGSFDYRVTSLEYQTGNDEKTTYDFARDIQKKMAAATGPGGLNQDDKIAFVMHSQGGLVGSIWMLQSLLGTEGFGTPDMVSHLDAFITIGTPFWGAKSAEFGRNIDGFFTRFGIDLKVPFGSRELQEMSIGSDTVYDFRIALVSPVYRSAIEQLKKQVRLLNIAGTARVLNAIGIFASGGKDYEDDGAVPLPSARFNFLFNQSIVKDYSEDEVVPWVNTHEVDFAPCIVVDALHRSPLPQMSGLQDIVYVPEACIEDENCSHPTFGYIWRHLLGENVIEGNQDAMEQYKSFLIDVNVRHPESDKDVCRDITIEFRQPDGLPLDHQKIEISNFFELFSSGKNKSVKYPNQCRYYFTGNLYHYAKEVPSVVLMTISGEGLKTRKVEVLLKPSYSSFVDVNLIEK